MRYIISILSIFFFTGATKSPEETRHVWHRSFYAEMKGLEKKPERVTAFSAVQTATNVTYSGTTCSVTTSSTSSNNILVVHIFILSTNSFTSVTDNQSNTYAVSKNEVMLASYRMVQAYGVQTTGGVTTVTVTVGSATDFVVVVDEFSGLTGTPTNAENYDTVGSNGAGGELYTNPFALGTAITPVQSGCLISVLVMNLGAYTYTAGTGYTMYGTGIYSGGAYLRSMYKLSSSTSETVPWSTSNDYYAYMIAVSIKQEDWVPPPPAGKAIRSAGN